MPSQSERRYDDVDPYAMKWRAVRRWPPDTVSCSWSGHRTWIGAWLACRRKRAAFDGLHPDFDRSVLTVERGARR